MPRPAPAGSAWTWGPSSSGSSRSSPSQFPQGLVRRHGRDPGQRCHSRAGPGPAAPRGSKGASALPPALPCPALAWPALIWQELQGLWAPPRQERHIREFCFPRQGDLRHLCRFSSLNPTQELRLWLVCTFCSAFANSRKPFKLSQLRCVRFSVFNSNSSCDLPVPALCYRELWGMIQILV